MHHIEISGDGAAATVAWGDDSPLTLAALSEGALDVPIAPSPLVLVFTDRAAHAHRLNHTYADSVIGRRLRYVCHDREGSDVVVVQQRDAETGLIASTRLSVRTGALAITHTVINRGASACTVLALGSVVDIAPGVDICDLSLTWGRSGWTTEHRWQTDPVDRLLPPLDVARWGDDLDAVFAVTSEGLWSTSSAMPAAVVGTDAAAAMAWSIESAGPWHWEVRPRKGGGVGITLMGGTDREHQASVELEPGASTRSATVVLAPAVDPGRHGFASLTRHRRSSRTWRPADAAMPVVFNDYMNTLMGDPTTQRLQPLIAQAASAGAEVFCIDAGWFAPLDGDDWWNTVGGWRVNEERFVPGGLGAVADEIRASGMAVGLWFEPEVVGVNSEAATALPDEAFFQRFGRRVVTQERYHLDFRHPAARAHVDAVIDHAIAAYGLRYLKLDHNIDPRPGTTTGGRSPGAGLAGHLRAYRAWLRELVRRHPAVLVENCASGAMRMDARLLRVAQLQSSSDQQDALLSTVIAAGAPAMLTPEQSGNWAYPSADMDIEHTALTLANGLAGRLYLAGLLHELDDEQRRLVHEAVVLSKGLREPLARSTPWWPSGMPAWDAAAHSVALDLGGGEHVLVVWSRGAQGGLDLRFDAPVRTVEQIFPEALPQWPVTMDGPRLHVAPPADAIGARVLRVTT